MIWPTVLELNLGETVGVEVGGRHHKLGLHDVLHEWAPDDWIEDNPSRRTLRAATVYLEVDGQEVVLVHRPYQLPVEIGDLQLYVETTREWATACNLAPLLLDRDIRLSVGPAGTPWGPAALRFPVADYRWRSASYNNTWSALVPYNLLYYHRGEDFGAIPDRLPVLAVTDGEVIASPVPTIQGSNSLAIRSSQGLIVRYAHMNIETIDPGLAVGARVVAGQTLGQTGCTWDGRRSQWADPHLHVGLARDLAGTHHRFAGTHHRFAGTADRAHNTVRISPYPFLVEAYLRDYEDVLLPVAGGYEFTTVGEPVTLDATRTVVRPGHGEMTYSWQRHDGSSVEGPRVEVVYGRPGQYAETLIVRTGDGHEARDSAHVRVYDPSVPPEVARETLAYGWVYAAPIRTVPPGLPVTFWNRLVRTRGDVTIDYGDGTPVETIAEESVHAYDEAGIFTVTVAGRGAADESVMASLNVVVA